MPQDSCQSLAGLHESQTARKRNISDVADSLSDNGLQEFVADVSDVKRTKQDVAVDEEDNGTDDEGSVHSDSSDGSNSVFDRFGKRKQTTAELLYDFEPSPSDESANNEAYNVADESLINAATEPYVDPFNGSMSMDISPLASQEDHMQRGLPRDSVGEGVADEMIGVDSGGVIEGSIAGAASGSVCPVLLDELGDTELEKLMKKLQEELGEPLDGTPGSISSTIDRIGLDSEPVTEERNNAQSHRSSPPENGFDVLPLGSPLSSEPGDDTAHMTADLDAEDEDILDESLDPERIDALLEAADGSTAITGRAPLVCSKDKYVLVGKNQGLFEFLPPGWLQIPHACGMPVYCHKESRICTMSKPYGVGKASFRNHRIPISAIPCLEYRRAKDEEKAKTTSEEANQSQEKQHQSPSAAGTSVPPPAQSLESAVSLETASQPVETGVSTENGLPVSEPIGDPVSSENDTVSQKPVSIEADASREKPVSMQIMSADEHMHKSLLSPDEVHQYCSNLFQFETRTIRRFSSWKVQRAKVKMAKQLRDAQHMDGMGDGPSTMLQSGSKKITIIRPGAVEGAPQVVFVMNPANKTVVSMLHEFVQHVLKSQPTYDYLETQDTNSPYEARVIVNGKREGSGTGISKKAAKLAAAKEALVNLAPELRNVVEGENDGDESIFRDIAIDDPRVGEISHKAEVPPPYQILSAALRRINSQQPQPVIEVERVAHLKNKYSMTAGEHSVSVICQKRDTAKHLLAQKVLMMIHPELKFYGELLKMYGMQHQKQIQKRKDTQKSITELQNKGQWGEPNYKLLEKLKDEMRKVKPVPLKPGEKSRIRYK